MKSIVVNNYAAHVVVPIESVEKKYNAKFVGQLGVNSDNQWNCWYDYGDIYYQANPPVAGYSNYFSVIMSHGKVYITSGAFATDGIISAVVADNGEVIYSRCRHDYAESADGSCFIDGGRDYVHTNRKTIGLTIVDGEWFALEEEDYVVMVLKGEF